MHRVQLTLRLDPSSIRKIQDNIEAADTNPSAQQTCRLVDTKEQNEDHKSCIEHPGLRAVVSLDSALKTTSSGLISATPGLNQISLSKLTSKTSNKAQTRKRKRILEDDESSGEDMKTRSELHDELVSTVHEMQNPLQNIQKDIFGETAQDVEQADVENDHDLDKYDDMFDDTIEQSYAKLKKKSKDLVPKNKRARWSEDGAPFLSTDLSKERPSKVKKTKLVKKAERKMQRFLKSQQQDNGYTEMLKIIREKTDTDQIASIIDAGDVIIEMGQFNHMDVNDLTTPKVESLDFDGKGNNKTSKREQRSWVVNWKDTFKPAAMSIYPDGASDTESKYKRLSAEVDILLRQIQPQPSDNNSHTKVVRFMKAILRKLYPKCALHLTGPSMYGMALRNAPLDVIFLPRGSNSNKSNAVQLLSTVDDRDALLNHIKFHGASRLKHIIWSSSKRMIPGEIISMFDITERHYIDLVIKNTASQRDASVFLETWQTRHGNVFTRLVLLVHFIHYTHGLEFNKALKNSRPHEWDTICMVAAFFDLESQISMTNSSKYQETASVFLRFITFWTQWNYHDYVAEFDTDSTKYMRRRLTEIVGNDSRPQPIIGNPFGHVSSYARTFQEQILKLLSNFEKIVQTTGPPSLEAILGTITKKRWRNVLMSIEDREYDDPSPTEMDVDDDQF